MGDEIKKFTKEFFTNLRCDVKEEGDTMIVRNIPKSFEDLVSQKSPYKLNFSTIEEGSIFVGRGSAFLNAMTKYLEGSSKTTLLKIDFEVNPIEEIKKVGILKDYEISNVTKKHKNNFFSRFTFITTIHYLNKSDSVLNEIYIHEGKIVNGDLTGYNIIEGNTKDIPKTKVEEDYSIAKNYLKELLKDKIEIIGKELKEKLDAETTRIKHHYGKILGELGGDLNSSVEKIKKLELELRTADDEKKEDLKNKLDRLRHNLLRISDDDAKSRILKEQEFTLNDATHKHSLNIENKLLNATLIYYPIFSFNMYLKGDNSKRYLELNFDPLKKKLDSIYCEICKTKLSEINLCSGGHISCKNCLSKCSSCSKKFCTNCLKRYCSSCARKLCKDCSKMCLSCGKNSCETHLRSDSVTGEIRCVNCLRACLRCHGLSNPRYFGEAIDGSKVCVKCLGKEKRSAVMKKIFEN